MSATSIDIAVWLDRRLDTSLGFHLNAARLYGIIVNDAKRLLSTDAADAGAARTSFIGEDSDAYAMISGASGVLATSFDAAAIVTTGWAAPLRDDGSMSHAASRHPRRRRVRIVAVVGDFGVSSVIRFEDEPEAVVRQPERGIGDVVDALEEMWFGDPCALAASGDPALVNSRTTRKACQRRT